MTHSTPIDRPDGAGDIHIHKYRYPTDLIFVAALTIVCVAIGFAGRLTVEAWTASPIRSSVLAPPIAAPPTERVILIPGSPVVIQVTSIPTITPTPFPTPTRLPLQSPTPSVTPSPSFRSDRPTNSEVDTR